MQYKTILAIDTSSNICSVAICQDKIFLGEIIIAKKNSHSEIISNCIKNLLEKCAVNINQVDAIAISAGPGSYTGLRIGFSIAKGLNYGQKIPLICVDTLLAMAQYIINNYPIESSAILCPMLDARRMEVYTTVLEHNGNAILKTSSIVLSENFFLTISNERPVFLFGNGAVKCLELIKNRSNICILQNINPKASYLFEYLYSISDESFLEIAKRTSPIYLKEFENIIE